jgi:hypothetical protein
MTRSIEASGLAQVALHKLEAAETVARFYAAVQRYDCYGTNWEAIEPLIADQMVYLTPNLRDPAPVPRERFLERFKEIHDVHASEGRGSFYHLSAPVVSVDGGRANVLQQIAICHWIGGASGDSSWFLSVVEAVLVLAADGRWQIERLDVSDNVRVEGHDPPIDAFYPRPAQGDRA